MAARNRKTGLAALEKTPPPPATLPDLQAQGQRSRSRDSMSEVGRFRQLRLSLPQCNKEFPAASIIVRTSGSPCAFRQCRTSAIPFQKSDALSYFGGTTKSPCRFMEPRFWFI